MQGVQSVQGICFWGCSAVRHEYLGVHYGKKTVIHFLTMGKDGIKVSFGGTGEIIGGAGRSPVSRLPVLLAVATPQRFTS